MRVVIAQMMNASREKASVRPATSCFGDAPRSSIIGQGQLWAKQGQRAAYAATPGPVYDPLPPGDLVPT